MNPQIVIAKEAKRLRQSSDLAFCGKSKQTAKSLDCRGRQGSLAMTIRAILIFLPTEVSS